MSAFDDKGVNPPKDDDQVIENYLEHLVGDGKKFTDPEALAKGKHEADRHVKNLETQIAELREDIDQGDKLNELLEMVRNQKDPPKDDDTSKDGSSDTSSGQMTTEELKALIETHVSERDLQSLNKRNLIEADRALEEKFGEGAGRVLQDRARDLGMTVDEIKALAAKNPKAFVRLVGLDDNQNESTPFTGGGQRSEGGKLKAGESRNFAYYQKMRKEKKGHYYSSKIQRQMIDDRTKMGESAFYGNS